MKLCEIEKELEALTQLIGQWQVNGYVPTVEKNIALSRLAALYDKLSVGGELKVSTPQVEQVEVDDSVVESFEDDLDVVVEENQEEGVAVEFDGFVDEAPLKDVSEVLSDFMIDQSLDDDKVDAVEAEGLEENSASHACEPESDELLEVDINKELGDASQEDAESSNIEVEQHEEVTLFNTKITTQQQRYLIDELFWRDSSFFANEIRKFEEFDNLDDALIYIGERYNWAPDNVSAQKFIDMVDVYYNSK